MIASEQSEEPVRVVNWPGPAFQSVAGVGDNNQPEAVLRVRPQGRSLTAMYILRTAFADARPCAGRSEYI